MLWECHLVILIKMSEWICKFVLSQKVIIAFENLFLFLVPMNRKTGKQNKDRKCLFCYVYIFENNSVHLPATKTNFWIPHMATTPFVEPHFYVFFLLLFCSFLVWCFVSSFSKMQLHKGELITTLKTLYLIWTLPSR